MKFCLISGDGSGLPIALRIMEEGNDIVAYIHSKGARHCFDGLIPKVDKVPDDCDCYIVDTVGLSQIAERLRKAGKPVFNGTPLGDKAEQDRGFGLALAVASGIRVPYTRVFTDADKAIEYITEHKRKVVIKVSGRSAAASSSFIAMTPEAAARWIDRQQRKGFLTSASSFIVQDFVPGHEISTEVWYSHGKPIEGSANYTIETKKFAASDMYVNTGCQTSIVFAAGSGDKLLQETHAKVYNMFGATRETGAWDANTIVSHRSGNPFFLEWCGARFGYNAIFCLIMLMGRTQELSEVIYKAAAGEPVHVNLRKGYGFAIRVSIPPYPLELPDLEELKGVEDIIMDCMARDVVVEFPSVEDPEVEIFPNDVYVDKNGTLRCAGVDGILCEVASFGETIEEARDKALAVAKGIKCDSDIYYRAADATDRAELVVPNLASRGIITAPGYKAQPEPEEATAAEVGRAKLKKSAADKVRAAKERETRTAVLEEQEETTQREIVQEEVEDEHTSMLIITTEKGTQQIAVGKLNFGDED